MFDVLVIGAGLIGSSAARHLAEAGAHVGLIGPNEPKEYANHNGVFGSHYDESKIFRVLDRDAIWAQMAQSSLDAYLELEQRTGINFLLDNGFLRVDWKPSSHAEVLAVGRKLKVSFEEMDVAAVQHQHAYLQFSSNSRCILEEAGGTLNPRKLREAQIMAGREFGLDHIRDTVLEVVPSGHKVDVRTKNGMRYAAGRILIATGAFTNCFPLAGFELELDVHPETVLLMPVNRTEMSMMEGMPSIWYEFDWHASIPYAYVLPPKVYPDGRMYIKVGAEHDHDIAFDGYEDYKCYFQEMGSSQASHALHDIALNIMPGLRGRSGILKPCILTHTTSGYPMIDQVSSRVFVAVGGCGSAAKASDEIGRMAARLVEYRGWHHDLPGKLFRSRLVKKRLIG